MTTSLIERWSRGSVMSLETELIGARIPVCRRPETGASSTRLGIDPKRAACTSVGGLRSFLCECPARALELNGNGREARESADLEYAEVAGAMPFVEGTLEYAIYREPD
jgi:hypothetical protein